MPAPLGMSFSPIPISQTMEELPRLLARIMATGQQGRLRLPRMRLRGVPGVMEPIDIGDLADVLAPEGPLPVTVPGTAAEVPAAPPIAPSTSGAAPTPGGGGAPMPVPTSGGPPDIFPSPIESVPVPIAPPSPGEPVPWLPGEAPEQPAQPGTPTQPPEPPVGGAGGPAGVDELIEELLRNFEHPFA